MGNFYLVTICLSEYYTAIGISVGNLKKLYWRESNPLTLFTESK